MYVFTSITGGKDNLLENHEKGKAKFLAFTDQPIKSKLWKRAEAYDKFVDKRRNSRIPKILAHKFLDTEYSIWVDGNIRLLRPPEWFVDTYLKDHDIMFYNHTTRDCIYDEAITCAKSKLDDPEAIIEQAKHYEDEGYGKHKGLYVGNFILRRHTPKVEAFNNAWWSEYCRYSVRDQISLPYALEKVGLRVKTVTLPWAFTKDNLTARRGDEIEIYPHVIKNPPTI